MTEELKTVESSQVEGTTSQVEQPPTKEEIGQLRSDLQKMEQNLKSAQGVTKKQTQELEKLQTQYENVISSQELYKAILAIKAEETGKTEDDIFTEGQTRKIPLTQQIDAKIAQQEQKRQQQEQQRQYAQFNQKVNDYQKTVDELGLKPTDKTYKHIRALVRSGDFETADEEIEAIKTKPPTSEPKKEEQKVELTEEEKEKISKEYLEKKGLLKSETGAPSTSAPRGFAKIEQDYADGLISTAKYEEAMKERGTR